MGVVAFGPQSHVRLTKTLLPKRRRSTFPREGWVQKSNGEWEWEENDSTFSSSPPPTTTTTTVMTTLFDPNPTSAILSSSTQMTTLAKATPTLPSGSFRPKQSLGQNFLKDGNTVAKILRAFLSDATQTWTDPDDDRNCSHNNSGSSSSTTTTTTTTPKKAKKKARRVSTIRAVELGPGAGALTDSLVPLFHTDNRQGHSESPSTTPAPTTTSSTLTAQQHPFQGTLQCIEIDPRSIQLLAEKHPQLHLRHMDVLQTNYAQIAQEEGGPLSIIGNLPYYITSQILFALADASHTNSIRSATVTMQYEVAQRIIAQPNTKEYGILSVVFQLYAQCTFHFKIPPTVFYPQPKVDSALMGFHFYGPTTLRSIFSGVLPKQLKRVVTTSFQQRRKTLRNSLKKMIWELCDQEEVRVHVLLDQYVPLLDSVVGLPTHSTTSTTKHTMSTILLPKDWSKLRPEQLSPMQFVELTRWLYQVGSSTNPKKENHDNNNTLVSHDSVRGNSVDTLNDEYDDTDEAYDEDTNDDDWTEIQSLKNSDLSYLGSKVWRRLKHGAND